MRNGIVNSSTEIVRIVGSRLKALRGGGRNARERFCDKLYLSEKAPKMCVVEKGASF